LRRYAYLIYRDAMVELAIKVYLGYRILEESLDKYVKNSITISTSFTLLQY